MLPDYLRPTQKMLTIAFPGGVARDEYFAVISILHGHYSLRNLAAVVAEAFGRDYSEVYTSDIGRALELELSTELLQVARQRMEMAGFKDCIRDDIGT